MPFSAAKWARPGNRATSPTVANQCPYGDDRADAEKTSVRVVGARPSTATASFFLVSRSWASRSRRRRGAKASSAQAAQRHRQRARLRRSLVT